MVLQAAPQQSIVWGFAPTIAPKVSVCISGGTCVDAVLTPGPVGSNSSIFTAKLAAVSPTATAFNVSAVASSPTAADQTIWLRDVVFGDVFVCSGQSNLDFALPMAFNATAEGEIANGYPDIRLFTVQKCEGGSPHHCQYTRGQPALEFLNASFIGQQWVRASKESVYGRSPWTAADYGGWESKIAQTVGGKGFSAVCWFFGRELYKRRKYPIGLIWSSIGGSPDEWWMPPAAFEACGSQPRIGDGWAVMISPLLRNVIKGVVSCLLLYVHVFTTLECLLWPVVLGACIHHS
jgi:sialate O-acetylesterase